MVKEYICGFCGCEVEALYHVCPKCDHENCIGWFDEIDGYHENGTGTMPDGTECGECSRESCSGCVAWDKRQAQRRLYGKWYCEECSNELEIWLDRVEEEHPAEGDGYRYERHHLIWHCTECGCDYENYWETQWGDTGESMIKRKYWG